jgi:hypothetical protein
MFIRSITLLLLVLAISTVHAQNAKLAGKVTDAQTGTPLVGATILYGSSKGVNTDVEGNFFIPVEKGKNYEISVTSVGYQQKVLNDVQVSDDAPLLAITLERATAQLSTVVVTSSGARRESISSLYSAQKNSSSISDGISAEVIRKSPDRNTGDVLKRVSGASVQDNKFVVIRGLSERYNVSLLNNSVLPSTEPDRKAFSFDIIPSSLIDNLVIFKSATPDLPGDFSGGAIKISTKDYPARKVSEVSFSAGYNSLTTFKNFYKGFDEGKYDALGIFDNKSRLIPAPYYKRRGGDFLNADPVFKRDVTKMFPNTFGYEPAVKSMPNFSFSYTGGNTAIIGSNKLGYIFSVGYGIGRRVVNRERNEPDFFNPDLLLYTYNTTSYDMRNNLSALANVTYSYGRSKISWKNLFNNDFSKSVAIRNGRNEVNTPSIFYYRSANSEAMNNGLYNSVVEGLHKVGKGLTLDWAGSYGLTYRNQPDQRILTFVTDDQNPTDFKLRVGTQNSPEIRNAGRVYSYLLENIYGANLNATKEFDWLGQVQKLKIGTSNYIRNRDVVVEALGYGTQNPISNPLISDPKGMSFSTILRPEIIDQYNLILAGIPTNSTDYNGQVFYNAGYLMLDNKFSDRVKFTWGARVEKFRQELTAKNQNSVLRDNTDVLPSFILTYALSKKSNLRLAGSQAVNRPEFRELADYSVYDYENFITVRGNPNLVRSKNNNADLRYEWFPSGGEIVSGSVFYKHFKNPIEQINQGNDVFSFANAENASAIGVEVEIRKKLDFINNDFFSRLTAYTNAAFIKGAVKFGEISSDNPLQGQSPYLINAGLSYSTANDGFSINALYNKIGPRLRARAPLGASLNVYEKPRDVLDVQVSKKLLHNRLEAKLSISDIFAQSFVWYYKYEPNPSNINYDKKTDRVMNSFNLGTTTTLSLRYNFGK